MTNVINAIPVEEGDHLTRLIHYVHLNPVRAGMLKRSEGLESDPWSSLSDYMKPPRKRRPWVAVDRGLGHMGIPDTAAGRRRFMEWTEGCVDWKKPGEAGVSALDGQSLQSTLRRGWYFGAEEFREKLLAKLGPGDEIGRDDWVGMRKGDWRKGLVAEIIKRRALVDNGWLAERLQMGARNAVRVFQRVCGSAPPRAFSITLCPGLLQAPQSAPSGPRLSGREPSY